MNVKRKFKHDGPLPEYLYETDVSSGSKTYHITAGTLLSVSRRPGLIAGKYEFLYAERDNHGLMLHVSGPDSRIVSERHRKLIREADIKQVHLKTRPPLREKKRPVGASVDEKQKVL